MSDPDRLRTSAALEQIGPVIIDAYVVVDADRTVADFNRHYRAMFPRAQARRLKGSRCCEFLGLAVCGGGECLAEQCMTRDQAVRYDEITAQPRWEEGGEERKFIVSGIRLGAEPPHAALLLLRDVSDAADVQRKYKAMLETEARERDRLREEIVRKTKELMDTNMELNRIQKELMSFKKGLFG